MVWVIQKIYSIIIVEESKLNVMNYLIAAEVISSEVTQRSFLFGITILQN